jgi:hypothetical protein
MAYEGIGQPVVLEGILPVGGTEGRNVLVATGANWTAPFKLTVISAWAVSGTGGGLTLGSTAAIPNDIGKATGARGSDASLYLAPQPRVVHLAAGAALFVAGTISAEMNVHLVVIRTP